MSRRDGLADTLVALECQVWDAAKSGDADTLRALFADDYLEITAEGRRVGKAEIVKLSPECDRIESYSLEDVKIVALGPNVGLVTYRLAIEGLLRGKPYPTYQRFATLTWVNGEGRWQCAFFQQTPIQPPR